jgi:hypothetical protein
VETPLKWGKSRVQFQSQASPTPLIIYKRINLEVMKVPKKIRDNKVFHKVQPKWGLEPLAWRRLGGVERANWVFGIYK